MALVPSLSAAAGDGKRKKQPDAPLNLTHPHPAETASSGRFQLSPIEDLKTHKLDRTCAQMATMPRNNDSEAKAAASSTTARNIGSSLV